MLNFICALKHEARPIIDHFQLVPDGPGRPFVTYCNRGNTISLTATGAGKHAAAAGTRHAVERYHVDPSDAWLNIGIAGHKNLGMGTPVLAGTVTDSGSGQVWHTCAELTAGIVTLPLVTVDNPLDDYPDDAVVDMEAAGFLSSVCTIGTMERIICLKIISDNLLNPSRNISSQTVISLITGNINLIDEIVSGFHAGTGRQPAISV